MNVIKYYIVSFRPSVLDNYALLSGITKITILYNFFYVYMYDFCGLNLFLVWFWFSLGLILVCFECAVTSELVHVKCNCSLLNRSGEHIDQTTQEWENSFLQKLGSVASSGATRTRSRHPGIN